jgi:2-polyprenyl-6-methoxyphenol hydroxylase-like FAD-dependent oxidoreductase
MTAEILTVRCAIAGGGPAGMMLGFLLARAGVEVMVLEKHADFLRDFRGDTIHPSTLELLHELGLLDEFLRLPHQEVSAINAQIGDASIPMADFSHLPTRCRFIALIPQWDFLNFLADHGRRFPGFRLRTEAEVTDLIEDAGRVIGLRATTPTGTLEVRADLVVGADGRGSVVRERAGLAVQDIGAPMDVLWFRLPRAADDPGDIVGRFDAGRIFIMINRGDYWQCGYVIAKGSLPDLQSRGLTAFRDGVARMAPFARERVHVLDDWNAIKLLTVKVDRLRQWYRPGLLCIGDAAHAMSPVGGVGINLAVQDAVAAANLLAVPLRERRVTVDDLRRVQQRRWFPTVVTQRVQVVVQKRVVSRVLEQSKQLSIPLVLGLMARFPLLRRLPARVIGLGVRPEHIGSPAART